jgi:hypothetical protein
MIDISSGKEDILQFSSVKKYTGPPGNSYLHVRRFANKSSALELSRSFYPNSLLGHLNAQ